MSLASILYSLASVPMFASRPFLAAFVTAILARFGHDIPWLRDHEVIHALSRSPEWFTSTWTLLLLAQHPTIMQRLWDEFAAEAEPDGRNGKSLGSLPKGDDLSLLEPEGDVVHDFTAAVNLGETLRREHAAGGAIFTRRPGQLKT